MNSKILLFTLILFSLSTFSQKQKYYVVQGDTIKKRPKFSIGTKHCGIGFGNFQKYSGIRFSVFDHDTLNNGISFNVHSFDNAVKITNGLELSLLFTHIYKINGFNFCPLVSNIEDGKGLTISGLLSWGLTIKGSQLTGGISLTPNVYGVCASGIANIIFVHKGIMIGGIVNIIDSISNGVTIAGLIQKTESFNGLSLAPVNFSNSGNGVQIGIFNSAKNLRGLQIGLININKRKKHFKVMPFLNFSFKKNT